MNYLDVISTREDMVSPGISACQGCGAELIMRRVLQVAGKNTIVAIPPGCMAGAGAVGWNYSNGLKIPVHIPLLTNIAGFMTGVSQMYERDGRSDVNIVCIAGDGGTADAGFQSLSAAAERNEKMLYVCYDNEGYMNTGYQRSSTTSFGSRTSTTPIGDVINGKRQHQKYVPMIMAMHGLTYCATASPSDMADMMRKIEKGLEMSKKGFAYIHMFSPCPTGWVYKEDQGISMAREAVKTNLFPLWEKDESGFTLNYKNNSPMPVADFVAKIGKFKTMSEEDIAGLQALADERYELVAKLAGE